MTDVIEPEVTDITSDSELYLYVGGEEFQCRRLGMTWDIVMQTKLSRDLERLGDPDLLKEDDPKRKEILEQRRRITSDLLISQHNIVMKLLKPFERERFLIFMETAELGVSEFDEALGDLISDIGGRGKEREKSGPSSRSSVTPKKKSAALSSKRATPKELDLEPSYSSPSG